MKITVKLFATLRAYHEKKEFPYEVEEGTQVIDVVKKLKLPEKDISIIMINGRGCKLDQTLKEDDILALFPPVGGG